MSLKQKVLKGTLWVYITNFTSKFVQIIEMVILARLLEPRDFGLVGIAWIFIRTSSIFQGLGISAALIYRKDNINKAAVTAFWLSFMMGITLFTICFLGAPYVAQFYREPIVEKIIKLLSFTFVLSSFRMVPDALLKKEIHFKKRAIPIILSTFTSATTAVFLAYRGYGVWSLVAGRLVGRAVSSVSIYFLLSWRPRFDFNIAIAKELLTYGLPLVGSLFFNFLIGNVDYAIVGRMLGMRILGLYTFAYEKGTWAMTNISGFIGPVLFPTLSKLQHDLEALRKTYLRVIRYISLVTIPFSLGLIAVAPNFIAVVYGEKWLPAVTLMQVVAIYGMVHSLFTNAGSIFKSLGKPGILLKINLFRLILLIPTAFFTAKYGILHVAIGVTLLHLAFVPIRVHLAHPMIKLKFSTVIQTLFPQIVSAFVMFSGVKLFQLVDIKGLDPLSILNLLVSVSLGVSLYVGSLLILKRDTMFEMKDLVISTFAKSRVST